MIPEVEKAKPIKTKGALVDVRESMASMLRDQIAITVLAGLVMRRGPDDPDLAKNAYRVADVMVKYRAALQKDSK